MSANGQLTAKELTLIQDGLYLSVKTARAWARLKTAAWKQHRRAIAAAQKAGAYRSLAVQAGMRKAWDSGSKEQKLAWNMDLDSRVRPAAPGESNHGWGTTIDIVGTPIDSTFRALARKYGFEFPYGDNDPRHAVHNGRTATGPLIVAKPVKQTTYVVEPDDTLIRIAGRYRTTVRKLLQLNPGIHDANKIYVGQKVRVA